MTTASASVLLVSHSQDDFGIERVAEALRRRGARPVRLERRPVSSRASRSRRRSGRRRAPPLGGRRGRRSAETRSPPSGSGASGRPSLGEGIPEAYRAALRARVDGGADRLAARAPRAALDQRARGRGARPGQAAPARGGGVGRPAHPRDAGDERPGRGPRPLRAPRRERRRQDAHALLDEPLGRRALRLHARRRGGRPRRPLRPAPEPHGLPGAHPQGARAARRLRRRPVLPGRARRVPLRVRSPSTGATRT